jgi:hypothetical protein
MGILEAENLVMLNEIDGVSLQAPQRLVQLPGSFLARAAVDLAHEEDFLPVAIAQSLTHARLAGAVVVVPAVVHEVDAPINRAPHDANCQRLVYGLQTKMPPAQPNQRHSFAGVAENTVGHFGMR